MCVSILFVKTSLKTRAHKKLCTKAKQPPRRPTTWQQSTWLVFTLTVTQPAGRWRGSRSGTLPGCHLRWTRHWFTELQYSRRKPVLSARASPIPLSPPSPPRARTLSAQSTSSLNITASGCSSRASQLCREHQFYHLSCSATDWASKTKRRM